MECDAECRRVLIVGIRQRRTPCRIQTMHPVFRIRNSILRKSEHWVFSNCFRIRHTCQFFRRECRNRRKHQSMSIFRRTNTLWQDVLHVFHYDTWASESRRERVRLYVHTTEPTGPVSEPFHCDHIARWSAHSGTTGPSGTGANTGAGCVPGPFRSQSCGVNTICLSSVVHSTASEQMTALSTHYQLFPTMASHLAKTSATICLISLIPYGWLLYC